MRLAGLRHAQSKCFIPVAWVAILVGAASAGSEAYGQIDRYELGLRLRRFEQAWEQAGTAARAAAVAPLERAVRNFFGMRSQAAAQQLDEAWFVVRERADPSAAERQAVAYRVEALPRVADRAERRLRVQLKPYYAAEGEFAATAKATIEIANDGQPPSLTQEVAWPAALDGVDVALGDLAAGDCEVRVRVDVEGRSWPLLPTQITRVDRWAERLQSLEQRLAERRDQLEPTIAATLATHARLLRSLARGDVPETDYPAARLLDEAEQWLELGPEPGDVVRRAAAQHDLWLTLAHEGKRVPVRLRAPDAASGPWPVLFLFHGAGGSENMFFETYGAGAAVGGGLERGWLVVAPRQGMLGMELDCEGMLEALAGVLPIDRERVALLGHSMGAGQVVRQVGRRPDLFQAAVALGGGGNFSRGQGQAGPAWWVAAGEFDFGKGGAARLAEGLRHAGAEVTYRELADVEHLVVVQAALPAAFQFLETRLAPLAHSPRASTDRIKGEAPALRPSPAGER